MYRFRDVREDLNIKQKEVGKIMNMHLTQWRRYKVSESEIQFKITIHFCEKFKCTLDFVANRRSL